MPQDSRDHGPQRVVTALGILLGAAALLLLLPITLLFTEVLLAVTSRGVKSAPTGDRRRLAVLVPAHNEASVIAGALRAIIPQLQPSDRLVVVADNCSDETAAVAISQGAEAIVRADMTRRGKGYALDFGVRHLAHDPPDVVIVIDADCQVAAGSIDRLARTCIHTARPTQALYLMSAPKDAAVMTRISEFAWVVKNQVRASGFHRLGLACQLMGTGMAFPWLCISTANLATGNIVEDLKLGIDLMRAGTPPLFCPEALVTSTFPLSSEGNQSQRARWEHGHLGVLLNDAPRLFLYSLARLDLKTMASALDLCVPPLALLVLQVVAVWVASVVFYAFTKSPTPLIISSVGGAMFVCAVLLSWMRYGRRILSLGSLAHAGLYILWKIPLYAKFLVARQVNWVRSKRDEEGR